MISNSHDLQIRENDDVGFAALIPYLLIAFGVAWGNFALLRFFPTATEALFGEVSSSNPLFILSVYAPAIAAVSIVFHRGGIIAIRRFLSRLLLWRCHRAWYAFLALGIPLIYYAGASVKGGLSFALLSLSPNVTVTAIAFMLILGPVEEFGWRGVALPLLQRRLTPIWASLILGTIWGVWHLPAFFLSGTPQSAWGFAPFLLGSIAVSIIVTPLFNASRGSILLAAVFHFQLNNPMWPDAQPYDTIFFVAAAMAILALNWNAMTTKSESFTRVIPPPARVFTHEVQHILREGS